MTTNFSEEGREKICSKKNKLFGRFFSVSLTTRQ
jgi:hypothetical protein